MFRIDLLQNEWLMLALIGGSALVLLMMLWYVVYWRTVGAQGGETPRRRVRVPAFLIVVYVAIALFAIGYVAAKIFYPPNW